jgi:hypothetical protein
MELKNATFHHIFGPGKFTLTINGSPSYLSLINSQTDTFIEPLGATIDYGEFPTSKLNIQATFDPDIPVSSVRMTFDNPNRTFCENKAPYAMFGDSKGDFYNATIPLGSHLATATPFGLPGCRGPPGIPIATNFDVEVGCDFFLYAHDTGAYGWNDIPDDSGCPLGGSQGYYRFNVFFGDVPSFNVSALPCNVNIEYRPSCGFDVRVVRMTLHNAVTKEVVHERTDREFPYFLFGTRTVSSTPYGPLYAASNNSIAPGSYTLTIVVNGIQQPTFNLFVGDQVKCTDCSQGLGRCYCPEYYIY